MTEDSGDSQSDRVQSVFTSIIKSVVNDICQRYVDEDEDYDYNDVMYDSAMVMIKEAAQIAVIMGVPKETYLTSCGEIFDVLSLAMSEPHGSA